MEITWLQLATLAIALVGAVLGVLNTWRTFSNDRVRLQLRAHFAFLTPSMQECLTVNVVNLSTFPLTVTGVGFELADGKTAPLMHFSLQDGGNFPKRLEPRTSLTALLAPGAPELQVLGGAVGVFANTACGLHVVDGGRSLQVARHNLSLAGRY